MKTAHDFEVYSTDKPVRKGSVMKKTLLVMGMVAVSGVLYSCGGSGSQGGTTVGVAAPQVAAPKVIASKTDATKTVSSSTTMAMSFIKGGMPSLGSLVAKPAVSSIPNGHRIVDTILGLKSKFASIQQRPRMLGKIVAAAAPPPETVNCGVNDSPADGTRTTAVTLDASGTSLTGLSITAKNCKDNDGSYSIENGSVAISGLSVPLTAFDDPNFTLDLSNVTLGLNLRTVDYALGAYATKTYESAQHLTINIGASYAANSMFLRIDGSMNEINYSAKESSKSLFTNFSMSTSEDTLGYTLILDGVANMETYNDITATLVDTKSGITFQSLTLAYSNSGSVSIDGTYAIATIPSCMDGTFAITTYTPITVDGTGMTTGGNMTVNGVGMVFDSTGGVVATIDDVPQTITAAEAKADACQVSFSEGIL